MNNNQTDLPTTTGIPRGVLALAVLVGSIEVLFSLGEMGLGLAVNETSWRAMAVHNYGVWLPLFDMDPAADESVLRSLVRLITYPFIDYSFVATLFGVVFILAMGKFISNFLNQVQVVMIFFLSTIVGGLGFGLFYSGTLPLIGSSPGFFGFFGGVFTVALLPIDTGITNRRALISMPLLLLGLQIVLGILAGGLSIWIADLAGFIAGSVGTLVIMFGFVRGFYIIVEVLFNRRDR